MSADKVILDVTFFRHLKECIEIQKRILSEPSKIREEWQNRINMTLAQCSDILDEKEQESLLEYEEEHLTVPMIPFEVFDDDVYLSYSTQGMYE